ncbi:MAG TPA: hypothetical protein P5080_00240 [Candidatus Paceibacterota bacterium]|nr:hypothetical protein [Candidatus Pacearchaeota archaeon]HRZ50403.1 hypothetical protein [Candidatus Paceibacterota bacterium]HSA36124.1 hypothetical protein [Candidatus Paceibacterota bacterium]
MKSKPEPREIELRALMKKMAAKDPGLIEDDSFGRIITKETYEERGDRIFFIATCVDAWLSQAGITIDDNEEECMRYELLELASAFGRFGLAVLDKKKDPFSRLEEADRIAALIKKKLDAKRGGEKSSAKTS